MKDDTAICVACLEDFTSAYTSAAKCDKKPWCVQDDTVLNASYGNMA
jgi:hypothetical protein